MTTITIELIQARQAELAEMIQQLASCQATQAEVLRQPETKIILNPGELYAGAVLDADGRVLHHLVLMAQRPAGRLEWQAAMDWANSVGGRLPDRQEQALLYANCKSHLEPTWHWSCVTDEDDASHAWLCNFSNGGQFYYRQSYEGSAVAVRSIPPGAGTTVNTESTVQHKADWSETLQKRL